MLAQAINFWVIDMFLMKPLESTSRSGSGIGGGLSGGDAGGDDMRVEYTTAVDGASVIPAFAVHSNPSQGGSSGGAVVSGSGAGADGKPRGGSFLTLMQPDAPYSPYGTTASPGSTPTHKNGSAAGANPAVGDFGASGMAPFQAGIVQDDRLSATYNYR